MIRDRLPIVAFGAALLLLGSCGHETAGNRPGSTVPVPVAAAPAPPGAIGGQPPRLGGTDFQLTPPRDGQSTGTFVGSKVVQLRGELGRLQASINRQNSELQTIRQRAAANAGGYHGRIGAIRSRLQVGTTPGNPDLMAEWSQSQQQLEAVAADIGEMNQLSNRVAADAAMAAYLLEATRAAFGLSGAVDEDHRQLAVLEDDVNRTVVLIDRLLTELSEDIRRQSVYVANERADLNTLALAIKTGEFLGASLSGRAAAAAVPPPMAEDAAPAGGIQDRRPLVVIRFDRPNVDYQQALYSAVSRALDRRPNATFDLVAVSPLRGSTARAALDSSAARRNAQAVLRSLSDMGLPPNRVALSATTARDTVGSEVRLYVR